jgi:hypothetical protein
MILFADNFREYASVTQLLDGMYVQAGPTVGSPSISLVTDPDPLSEGYQVIRLPKPGGGSSSSVWDRLRCVLPQAAGTVGASFRLFIDGMPSVTAKGWRITFSDSSNVTQVSARIETTGAIKFYNNDATLIAQTTVPVLVARAWNHVEIKISISDASGTIGLYVNGVSKLSATGLDTKGSASESTVSQIEHLVAMSDTTAGGYTYLKDLVYWDTSGSSNNDFLGDVSVVTLRPTADSSLTWTPSTGSTGWNLIDELPASDADYISTATTGANVFDLEDLPPEYVGVKALVSIIRMNKNDGGTAKVQVGLLSGGDEDTGADRPVTSAPTFWYDISEQNPDTASAWTPTAVNAAQLRINRTL